MVLANLCQYRRRCRIAVNSTAKNAESVAPTAVAGRNSLHWLALGAIVGIGLGCLTAAGWIGADPLPNTVIARVNDTDIRLLDYQRAVRMFASEKRDPVTDHDRAMVLERMVEEELLVQHAISSGLVRGDRGVRTTVLQSMLTGLMVELEAEVKELAGNNNSAETIVTGSATEIAHAADAPQDALLREYLGELRETATIRWVDGGSER